MNATATNNMALKGHIVTPETRAKISAAKKRNPTKYWLGKHVTITEEQKKKMSLAKKGKKPKNFKEFMAKRNIMAKGHSPWNKGKKVPQISGANHHLWKGGITPENHKIRASLEYKLWRQAVFERDNYTCRFCAKHGGDMEADHIKPFAQFPELRFAIDNGRTLCKPCHKTVHIGGRR